MSIINDLQSAVSNGADILGEILTWSVGSEDVTYTDIQNALHKAGMDDKFSRELCPRYAFSRACKELEEGRLIRKLNEDTVRIAFQFTKEALSQSGDELTYSKECIMKLEKKSGRISCDDPVMKAKAEQLLKDATEKRTASDVTKIVQRMFAKHADLFPVREQGGCYFVPKVHLSFVDRVEVFLGELEGHVNRFPILAGNTKGNASVKTVVTQGLVSLVEEHRKAIESYTSATMDSTFDSRYDAIEYTRMKCEGYADFLNEQVEGVYAAIAQAKKELAEARMRIIDAATAA